MISIQRHFLRFIEPRGTALIAYLLLFSSLLQLGTALQPDSLDAFWLAVLAYAAVNQWRPGVDYVFTYGPLGFLHPYLGYAPETFALYASGRVIHAAAHAGIILIAVRSLPRALWFPTCVFLGVASALVKTDAIEYIGLLSGFSVLWWLLESSDRRMSRFAAVVGLIGLLALIGFIKFTYLLVYAVGLGFTVADLLVHRRWRVAGSIMAAGTVLPMILWLLIVGDVYSLFSYLRWSTEIAAGYGPAMAMAGETMWTLAAGALLVALVIIVTWQRYRRAISTPKAVFVCVALFVVWQASFVRQDAGHMLVFYSVAAWVYASYGGNAQTPMVERTAGVLMSLAIVGWFWTWGSLLDSPAQVVDAFTADYRQNARAMTGAYQQEQRRRHAEMGRARRLDRITAEVGRSSVDLFGTEQSIVLLNGLKYQPRPVFQAHMAYTPDLAILNAAYLATPRAPEYMIARLNPVDSRFPASEDPLALVQLLLNYEPLFMENGFLLSRRALPPQPHEAIPGSRFQITSEQWFEVPAAMDIDELKLLRIEWQRTPFGKLLDFLWRPSTIVLETRDAYGAVRTYRLPIGSSEAGFIISPAILSTEDLARTVFEPRQRPVVAARVNVLGKRPATLKPAPQFAWFTAIRRPELGAGPASPPAARGG